MIAGHSIWSEADYRPAKMCRVCSRLIADESETCNEHAHLWSRIKAKAARVCEMARHKRHIKRVFECFTFERIVSRAERMVTE